MNNRRLFIAMLIAAVIGCKSEPKEALQSPEPAKPPVTASAPAAPASSAALSPDEQRDFYHLPEGGELLPLTMLRALESVKTFKPFMEDLDRFRLIPDPADPDGLPVGMAVTTVEGKRVEPRMVFFNCAACHTAQINYGGKSIRVDGAPAHFDMAGMIAELLGSLENTVTDPQKLAAFLERLAEQHRAASAGSVEKKGSITEKLEAEKLKLESAAKSVEMLKAKIVYLKRLRGLRPTVTGGFGRLDAFVAARNLLLGDKYAMDVSSPVSLPPIFGLSKLRWFHYDNNTTSILQRNIGESLGVGAVADLSTGESTVLVRNLYRLEQIVAKLPAPKWPEEVLGKIDAARASRGEAIYKKECASCHDVGPDGIFPDRIYDLATVGTDPNRALNFATPVGEQPFHEALAAAIGKVQQKAFEREHVTTEEAAKMEVSKVEWRTTRSYAARPIDGVWATAPYLHNGSVPTLYDLLRPPAERPKTFLTGSREFDPKKVGYVSDGSHGGTFLFDTSGNGNHNTGHTWGTSLDEEQRLDLLEYLKSR